MGHIINLKGRKFGMFTIIDFESRENLKTKWKCLCDCGNIFIVDGGNIHNGHTKSCGCLRKEVTSKRLSTHRRSRTSEYRIWGAMKDRCYNPNTKNYSDYGCRGIKICDRWKYSFENFIEDIGFKPTKNHSIDRINNDLDYSKENCKWSTKKKQNNNKRTNMYFTINGVTKSLSDWCVLNNIDYKRTWQRVVRLGLPIEDAMSLPKYYNLKH